VEIGRRSPTEFCVIGSEATIQMAVLNQQSFRGDQGTFTFIFDENGISPINVSAFLHLATAIVNVDGSNYTGGAGSFPLIDSTSLQTTALPANLTATGFSQYGLTTEFEQSPDNDKDWLQLILTENAYAIWAAERGLTAADTNAFADPDLDGTVNLIEYVLNSSPSDPTADRLPISNVIGNDIVFTFSRLAASENLTTQVFQYSSNLSEWTDLSLSGQSTTLGPISSDGTQSVTVTIDRSLALGERIFGRLKATLK